MTKRILLLGAGFSRNWGGWLASEVFEYLIGLPSIQEQPGIYKLLWKYQHSGGFEGALAELQGLSARAGATTDDKQSLEALEQGVMQMFAEMNAAFVAQEFEFGQLVRKFLTRFDAIYTLNQDILLERQYASSVFPLPDGVNRWNGVQWPCVRPPYSLAEFEPQRWLTEPWMIDPDAPMHIEKNVQPIIKLHGSSLWRRSDAETNVLIIGGRKAGAIAQDPLLNWYGELFREALNASGTRLMTIGYGFGDPHINQAISDGFSSGLKIVQH